MAILNVAPNSFSGDGVIDNQQFQDKLTGLLVSNKASYIDIGCESTAPMNAPISLQEEIFRLDKSLGTYLKQYKAQNQKPLKANISLDTYRPETFEHFIKSYVGNYFQGELIFNDVRGQIDQEYAEKIKYLKTLYPFQLVIGHSFLRKGDPTQQHMRVPLFQGTNQQFIEQIEASYRKAIELLSEHKNIILDPCFGFSKTREQNWYLVEHIIDLIGRFAQEIPWILGVSKKSFLRDLDSNGNPDKNWKLSEERHQRIIEKWKKEILALSAKSAQTRKIIFRVHHLQLFL